MFIGHRASVFAVVYSPRGDQVASASRSDKTIRIRDTVSGECLHTLVGHKKDVKCVVYSARSNLVASWSDYGQARLWDVETGECRWTLDYDNAFLGGSSLSHNFVCMTPDVDSFITGGYDGSVRVWDVIEEGDQCRVQMRWRSTNGQLVVEDANIQDVQGLSDLIKRLLKQRGAKGDPNLRLREASKKVMSMSSVVSKLKLSSSGTEVLDSSSTTPAISFMRLSERQAKQATDAEIVEK
ncbi:MAG: WD40-repeat-containing domain protein [Benniella sp.]|nr:MAG: WD40-repeat-containing domain protein [Benniella sp.]